MNCRDKLNCEFHTNTVLDKKWACLTLRNGLVQHPFRSLDASAIYPPNHSTPSGYTLWCMGMRRRVGVGSRCRESRYGRDRMYREVRGRLRAQLLLPSCPGDGKVWCMAKRNRCMARCRVCSRSKCMAWSIHTTSREEGQPRALQPLQPRGQPLQTISCLVGRFSQNCPH